MCAITVVCQRFATMGNSTELPGDAYTSPGDFVKFNGVFREAELIHLECYHLEIHLYRLFLELVCSTDIV